MSMNRGFSTQGSMQNELTDPVTFDVWTSNCTTSRVSQGNSIHQVWTLWDHSFVSCVADKQTDKQTNKQTNWGLENLTHADYRVTRHECQITRGWALDRVHNSRRPCGAVSLSGVTAERDGAARLSRRDFLHFLTLWPWPLTFWPNNW